MVRIQKTPTEELRYSLWLFDNHRFRRRPSRNTHVVSCGSELLKPTPWAEGDFEGKMEMLLHWANALNRSDPAFAQAQSLLEAEQSLIGRVIRRTKAHACQNV
jgi:hypothetical protein